MNIPMMWRKFFINIALSRDYKHNYCNNPYNKCQKCCYEWYLYNLSKNNTANYSEDIEQSNLNQLQIFLFLLIVISSQIAYDPIVEKLINQIQHYF